MVDFGRKGPYGPYNPPPPPPGAPPGNQERKQDRKQVHDKGTESSPAQDGPSPKGPGRAFLHRKLNSRQRKHFRNQQAASAMPQVRGRSRSPPRDDSQNNRQGYHERSPVPNHDHGGSFDNEISRRGPLRNARQITPDHIMDDTRGRLSPIEASGNVDFYQADREDLRSTRRTDWPDDPSNQSWRGGGGQGVGKKKGKGFARRERSKMGNAQAPLFVLNPEPTWNSNVPPPASVIEDEIDWDDGDIEMPTPTEAYRELNARDFRAQLRANDNPRRISSAQPSNHSFEPAPSLSGSPHQQYNTDVQPWMNTAKQAQSKPLPQIKPTWAVQPEHQPQGTKFDKRKGVGNSFVKHTAPEENPWAIATKRPQLEETTNHLTALIQTKTPNTVYDLREYDMYITNLHNSLPKNKAYRNGNGKTGPGLYGSTPRQDLGLCFVTFVTEGWCEMGIKCVWRHHPLTKAEREWILSLGKDKAKMFLANLPKCWASPEVPVPGANMVEKMDRRNW